MTADTLAQLVVRRTCKLPIPFDTPPGDGQRAALQFDAVLMELGWKCSGPLLARLGGLDPSAVIDLAVDALGVLRAETGAHVRHNAYFIDFPANVPDTISFWAACLADALGREPAAALQIRHDVASLGGFSLLDLPSYGRYQHAFADLVAAHAPFEPAAADRLTFLHPGGDPETEAEALFGVLAASRVPLSAPDRALLDRLARDYAGTITVAGVRPPVAENAAIVSAALIGKGLPAVPGTITDVLRLAAHLSGGDVTLAAATKFRSFTRAERRGLMDALNTAASSAAKLADVAGHAEAWKRLGEGVHPHEFEDRYPDAAAVFHAARTGDRPVPAAGRAADLIGRGETGRAARLLEATPGVLFRRLDWLLRAGAALNADGFAVIHAAEAAAPRVSGRVLLSVREHLGNRTAGPGDVRVFAGKAARAWVTPDTRPPLDAGIVAELASVIDAEITRRLPAPGHLITDSDILSAALPLSGKAMPAGSIGTWPRGSITPLSGDRLRFFTHWQQDADRTDYDLSLHLLDGSFAVSGRVSFTSLHASGAVHSGDIVEASGPGGATEFIDVDLTATNAAYLLPQVLLYCGEPFADAAESFFGFMTRDAAQRGMPFEPATVRHKSEMRGAGTVAMPVAFYRGDDGRWRAKWIHLYAKGRPSLNTAEGHALTTTRIGAAIMRRDYLQVRYLTGMLTRKATRATAHTIHAGVPVTVDGGAPADLVPGEPVTYVGTGRPAWLPAGATAYTLGNLADLIPA